MLLINNIVWNFNQICNFVLRGAMLYAICTAALCIFVCPSVHPSVAS